MSALRSALRIRTFTSSAPSNAVKRLPTLAAIPACNLEQYRKETTHEEELAKHIERQAKEVHEKSASNPPKNSLIKNLLYGDTDLQKENADVEISFSQRLKRDKYIHEIVFHDVLPHAAPDYVDLISKVYPRMSSDPTVPMNLVGSWRTVVGDLDRYVHIWQYDSLSAMHGAAEAIYNKDYYFNHLDPLRKCLRSRNNSIIREFSFWGATAEPRHLGGLFELRSYDLKPGKLLEWESYWRSGIEIRRKVMEPVGAWFSSLGPLNKVYHIWQFVDLDQRQIARNRSWQLKDWAETTHKTVELVSKMEATIMIPLDFSPLR